MNVFPLSNHRRRKENEMKNSSLIKFGKIIAALVMTAVFCAGGAARSETLVIAHRGASSQAPENTLAAFRLAKELGADGVETDVRLTADGQLVLGHDDAIDRTSDGHGLISGMTLEELKTFDFGSWFSEAYAGEKILTLDEFLEAVKELDFRVIDLEMKPVRENGGELVRQLVDAVRRWSLQDRVTVSSFDSGLLMELREYAPEFPAAILTVPNFSAASFFNLSKYLPEDKPLIDYTLEDVRDLPGALSLVLMGFGFQGNSPEEIFLHTIETLAASTPPGVTWDEAETLMQQQKNLPRYVDGLGFPVDDLNCHYSSLNTSLTENMRDKGIGLIAWTVDTEQELEKAFSYQLDGVITDDPGLALALREQGPSPSDQSRVQ